MDEIQKVLVKSGRKDLAQKYYKKVAGIGYELYAKGLDRISVQCVTISDNAKILAKLVRENTDDRKKKKSLKNLKTYVNVLNKEMESIVSDIDNLEGYKVAQRLSDPIIPDAIKLISKNNDALKYTNKIKFDKFLDKQKYFSASESHCFYNKEDMDAFHKGEKDSERECVILKNVGNLVAVWDNDNRVGYIIPSDI